MSGLVEYDDATVLGGSATSLADIAVLSNELALARGSKLEICVSKAKVSRDRELMPPKVELTLETLM